MIKSGLNKLISRGYDWPPSAPEFSKLCRPSVEDFNIPPFDDAINLIGRLSRHKKTRLDPFTYSMYSRIGGRMYDLNRMAERDYRSEMKRYYDATVKLVLSGGELFVQPELIEHAPKEAQPIKDGEGKFEDLKRSLSQ